MKFLTAATMALCLTITPSLSAAAGLIRDAEIERTLHRLSDPIFQVAGISPSTVDIYILSDPTLNAFVAGGRNLFLNTGLLIELETPEELIGVIAHETGHIAGGHLAMRSINVRNATGPALAGLLLAIAAGVAGGGQAATAIAAGSQSIIRRTMLSFSRAEEASADAAALSYLARTRIDPTGFAKVLERFRGEEVFAIDNVDPYVLTHPLSTQRLQLVERRVDEDAPKAKKMPAETYYWHSRMRAKLEGFLKDPQRVLDEYEGAEETEFSLYAKTIALHRLPSEREAIKSVDRLISKRPSDPYYVELKGQILYESGRVKEAVEQYRNSTKLAPGEPLLKAGLGRALLALDTDASNREALKVLESVRRVDARDAAAMRDLAVAYDRAGKPGMASLATAERLALRGSIKDAALFANRAAAQLPEGSPGWLRAQDILNLKKE